MRRETEVVGIDAVPFYRIAIQYTPHSVLRELNKVRHTRLSRWFHPVTIRRLLSGICRILRRRSTSWTLISNRYWQLGLRRVRRRQRTEKYVIFWLILRKGISSSDSSRPPAIDGGCGSGARRGVFHFRRWHIHAGAPSCSLGAYRRKMRRG